MSRIIKFTVKEIDNGYILTGAKGQENGLISLGEQYFESEPAMEREIGRHLEEFCEKEGE